MSKELDDLVLVYKEQGLDAVSMWTTDPKIPAVTEYHGDFVGALLRNGLDPEPWFRFMKGEVVSRDGTS